MMVEAISQINNVPESIRQAMQTLAISSATAEAKLAACEAGRNVERTIIYNAVTQLNAIRDLADWHETKAEKARRFPGGSELVMEKAAQVHLDAARRIRRILYGEQP